jgi:hypothetical protein
MRAHLVIMGLCTLMAFAPAVATGQGGNGNEGGGNQGGNQSGPNGQSGNQGGNPGGTVHASEPLSLALTGAALVGAAILRRRR